MHAPRNMRAIVSLGIMSRVLIVSVLRCNIGDLRGPVLGIDDRGIWGYCSYYFIHNLSLNPLPHLDLVNNQALYPYGADQVFQPWASERDLARAAPAGPFSARR